MKETISIAIGAIGAGIASLLGGWDASIITLLCFMVVDYISGLILAGVFKKSPKSTNGGLSSKSASSGLFKKFMLILVVIVGARLDTYLEINYIRDAICIVFITNELLSIVENIGLMGVPMPKFIINAVEVLKKETEQRQSEVSDKLEQKLEGSIDNLIQGNDKTNQANDREEVQR